ncbi:DUF6588 family protein [uncultured Polaribacter sp.]|uniref:DUF6588 family protein n=1 Tax=uncultured Polaribacter sp. TaxID=174711 RepID=UPI00260F1821|nr:DUF6588 family protein [uncultured Polaribacter sp.]
MKKIILTLSGVFLLTVNTKAQNGFENALLSDARDAKNLIQAYFQPGMEGFINAMNSGWYHTAKVHKKFGFDISIGASAALVPSEKEMFNIVSVLGSNSNITSNSATASTFAGPSNSTRMSVNRNINGQDVSAEFDFPGGVTGDLPVNGVPAPIAQLSVGLPWKMEAMVRVIPKIDLGEDEGTVNMLGFGIKKEITDWFGPLDKTPLHVSLLAAYTTMNVDYEIGDVNTDVLEVRNGLTNFNLTAFTAQAIASLNFPIINIYGGVGYNSGSSSFEMTGDFQGVYQTGLPSPNNTVRQRLLIPSNLNFESNGFMTTAGLRLSLGFLKIFGSYTIQEYNTANLGIAISIR